MPIAAPDTYTNLSGGTIYAGRFSGVQPPAPPPGTVLSTIALANETGSTQPAGFVSPMFGIPFRQGEMAAGDYPQFKLTSGADCPATLWGLTSWPDGSMKFCAAMVRVPEAVAAGSSLTVEIQNGGIAPAPSPRTADDLLAADIKVELTGVTNLAGLWTASLNDAIASASDVTVIGSGAAGKIWRIGGPFKQAGTPHTHLYCWHYVLAAQNSSNGLAHLMYLGRVSNSFPDVSGPLRREVSCVVKSGSTVIRTLVGRNLDGDAAPGSTIGLPHLGSFYTSGAAGTWDFVQGGGSTASAPTVRVTHNTPYWVATKLFRPQKTSFTPAVAASQDYFPNCKGEALAYYTGTTGPRAEIGTIPLWAARHLITQSAVDERIVRVSGLAQGGYRTNVRLASTKQIVPCIDPSPSYAGLGAIRTTWRYWGAASGGFQLAPDNNHVWGGEYESHHRGAMAYYAYMLTGEPQYLDMMVEVAAATMLNSYEGTSVYKTTQPITVNTMLTSGYAGERRGNVNGTIFKGAGIFTLGGLVRFAAWSSRDVAQAAAVYPDVCPSGTETRKYLREVLDEAYREMVAYKNARSVDWQNSGILSFNGDPLAGVNPWCSAYLSESVCHQASILQNPNAVALRQFIAKFWKRIYDTQALGAIAAYNASFFDENGVQADSVDGICWSYGAEFTFSTATNRCTISGPNGKWSPTNGDVFAFATYKDADKPFPEAVDCKRFYAVNCSGQTFQLSAMPGGAPLTVTADVTISECFVKIANQSPNFSFQTSENWVGYFNWAASAIAHHVACGDTELAPVHAAAEAATIANGINVDGSIYYATNSSYGD